MTSLEQHEIDVDLFFFDEERHWRKALPRLEEAQWLNIFPQAKPRYGRLIKGKLKLEKEYLNYEKENIKARAHTALLNNPPETAWRDEDIKQEARECLRELERRLRRLDALIVLVGRSGKPASQIKKQEVNDEMIARARQYPLAKLLEINRAGFAKCIWHNERTASMFCKNNFVHCFSCARSGDTIAVLMQRDGIKFKEAVLLLQ